MNVIVVDTSSWISYFRGSPNSDLDLGLKEGRVYLPPIVASELLSAKMKAHNRKALVSLLRELPICLGDLDHWIRVGELRAFLASKGISLSAPDAHIAQCTLDLQGYLLTEDSIFKKVVRVTKLKLLQELFS